MGTLANSEDPDEMLHNVAFHQGLHCLQRGKLSSEKELFFFYLILNVPSSIFQINRDESSWVEPVLS